MSTAEKAVALLSVLSPSDVQSLPPAKRRQFADICRYLASIAEPPRAPPKAGILHDLRFGRLE